MKKTKQSEKAVKQVVFAKKEIRPSTNRDEIPYLYIAMKEPSEDYKQAGRAQKKELYRFIKVK